MPVTEASSVSLLSLIMICFNHLLDFSFYSQIIFLLKRLWWNCCLIIVLKWMLNHQSLIEVQLHSTNTTLMIAGNTQGLLKHAWSSLKKCTLTHSHCQKCFTSWLMLFSAKLKSLYTVCLKSKLMNRIFSKSNVNILTLSRHKAHQHSQA